MKPEIIVTLGPATNTEYHLRKLKDEGVAFVRINMSHSTIEDLRFFIGLAKKVGIPFIIDTEGSQIRTGNLVDSSIQVEENDEIKIFTQPLQGDATKICLTPGAVVGQLEAGDILRLDFDTLILRISDVSTLASGYVLAKVVTGGMLGKNKGVVVDSASNKHYVLPALTEKDYQSIQIGLAEGVGHIAASFMRSGIFVDEVRRATQGKMKIISKIECIDGLNNLDDIIAKSDAVLIDRGDLSKEISLERIPLSQKIIVYRARKSGKGAIVATNLLETMVKSRKPTRAEIHDITSSVLDGATGLTLAAETAIGNYPIECVHIMQKMISHVTKSFKTDDFNKQDKELIKRLDGENYLLDYNSNTAIVVPHGGKLINRCAAIRPEEQFLSSLPIVQLNENQLMDLEQIAIGTFSPLEGFMNQVELESVLEKMRLPSGVVWPMPIILDVSEEVASSVVEKKHVALANQSGKIVGLLNLEEIYNYEKEKMAEKLYGTLDASHPGVKMIRELKPVFLSGKIELYERRKSPTQEYELTPLQVRKLFEEKNWGKVVGFHTRNVIHRSHEFIQMEAMEQELCDGLFVHPVVGQKKVGDFQAKYIIQSYEIMMKRIYPKNRVLFSVLATYSRYAGPREAIFTALCRKNFGCSEFIVGRDHTGVGNFYSPTASHDIFQQFPELGIKPVYFNKISYSTKNNSYVKVDTNPDADEHVVHISGTEARKMFESHQIPPEWYMRSEISNMIIKAVNNGEEVFVK